MDILKAFKLDQTEVKVNISGTEEDPLFQANQIGEILGLSNIRVTLKDFDEDEKVVSNAYTLGGNQQITFLTEVGLYRLLALCRKPVARVFQKWVCQVVKEIRLNGKYELQRQRDVDMMLNAARREKDRHDTLLNAFNNKRVVYLTRLKCFNDEKNIVKLGWTNDIQERQRALATKFASSTFQDIFECNQNQEFELFLKRHRDIAQHAYRDDIIEGVRSTETYLLSLVDYEKVVKIIKRNIKSYQGFSQEQFIELQRITFETKKLDIQKQALDLLASNIVPSEVLNALNLCHPMTLSTISSPVESNYDDLQEDTNEQPQMIGTPRTNTKNRRMQQYDSNTFELIKTYDGIMDTIRQNPNMSKFGIKHAALNNTIYHGYRWFFLDRDEDDIKHDIPPTKEIISSIPRYIAMLNHDHTEILNVFTTLSQAASAIDSKRKTTIHEAIVHDKLVRKTYRFKYFDDCTEVLRNEYMSRNKLPSLTVAKGTMIQQIDIHSRECIKTYSSIANVLKNFVICRESLKRACATGEACKGYLWKYVTEA